MSDEKPPTPSTSRRRFLRAAGTLGAIALPGCTEETWPTDAKDGLVNETERNESAGETPGEPENETENETEPESDADADESPRFENGAAVFVYDDGPIEDYTDALPVHREFDAPATAGVVSEWVDREHDSRWMDPEHLDELVSHGWEIASHTHRHTTVAQFDLVEDVPAGATTLPVTHYRLGHHDGLEVELLDPLGESRQTATIAGFRSDPHLLELETGLDEPLPADSVVRYPAAFIHESLRDSRAALEAMGYEVSTFLAPYDKFDDYSRGFAREYYDGVANAHTDTLVNDPETFDPFETRRGYFVEGVSREWVRDRLDEVAETGALGILGAHTFKDEVTPAVIRETLEWIDERGIEVLTLRDAIDVYSSGSRSRSRSGSRR